MSEPTHEPETTDDTTGGTTGDTTGGPSDEELPGHRGDGPDPDPVDAAEAEGGEVGAG
ncbi:hypothetical protein [Nocardioides marmoraquaticus]